MWKKSQDFSSLVLTKCLRFDRILQSYGVYAKAEKYSSAFEFHLNLNSKHKF